jgi:hypothetical protein
MYACRGGYQLAVQLTQPPQGIVTVYPSLVDPAGAAPHQSIISPKKKPL